MRTLLFVTGFLAAAVAMTKSAEAQNWCAHYSTYGATNCGFITYGQCMATVSGIGGFCAPSTQYVPRPYQYR